MHENLCLVAGKKVGHMQSLVVSNWRSLCGSNVGQIACTHAPFITQRMQRSMRELLGLESSSRATLKGVSSTSNYSASDDALANINYGPGTYYMHVKSTVASDN